jgi:hypothetical protein
MESRSGASLLLESFYVEQLEGRSSSGASWRLRRRLAALMRSHEKFV